MLRWEEEGWDGEVIEEREGDQNNRGEILNPFYSFAFWMGVIKGTKQRQTENHGAGRRGVWDFVLSLLIEGRIVRPDFSLGLRP